MPVIVIKWTWVLMKMCLPITHTSSTDHCAKMCSVFYFIFYFFSVRLLLVLRGHSFFSSPPQWPMTSDFEGFSIPDFIHYIYFPILILDSWERASIFPFECSVLNNSVLYWFLVLILLLKICFLNMLLLLWLLLWLLLLLLFWLLLWLLLLLLLWLLLWLLLLLLLFSCKIFYEVIPSLLGASWDIVLVFRCLCICLSLFFTSISQKTLFVSTLNSILLHAHIDKSFQMRLCFVTLTFDFGCHTVFIK